MTCNADGNFNENQLLSIQKPAQYLGGELGSVDKSGAEVDLHFCLAFPDTYEVGMSHIGMQILYDLINRDPHAWAERSYLPLPDMEALLRNNKMPLRSLEAKRPLKDFDIVGFSLQYELCGTGVLTILDLGGIPLLARDRAENDPLVVGGGPFTYHPEPFAEFFDLFLIGDGEELVVEFNAAYRRLRAEKLTRAELLSRLAEIQGVYVPSLFEPLYGADGKFTGFEQKKSDYAGVRRRIISTLVGAPYPTKPVIPNIAAIHDRLSVEVMRGCVRGCRFCQAGFLYRPQRERSPEEVINIVGKSLEFTGYEELSLLSLSTADYCSILPTLSKIKEKYADNDRIAISFPSTRVDSLKPELLQEVQEIRRGGFTIAPEAGTQRLRDAINKGVTNEQLMETCENVFRLGWTGIKMYFCMIGLPTETDEDLQGIADTARSVKNIAKRYNNGRNQLTVSVSTLVPKPHTPFQWAEQITEAETVRKQKLLGSLLGKYRINLRYHNSFSSFLEGVFARGDRKLHRVIMRAYQLGCRLEGWTEKITEDMWREAFALEGIEPDAYLRERGLEEALPWDHISCDIPKSYFLKEWQRTLEHRVTPDCLTQTCSNCGACDYDATRNELYERTRTEERLGIVNPAWNKIINERERKGSGLLLTELSPTEHDTGRQEQPGTYELRDYLKTESDNGSIKAVVVAPELQRIRLQFSKSGSMRFTAHLELSSVFFRALRRVKAPISFSRGFNPKPRMSFGPPIQLGIESKCEFLDVFLLVEISQTEIEQLFIQQLNSALPQGILVHDAQPVALKAISLQASITSNSYEARLINGTAVGALPVNWKDLPIQKERRGKPCQIALGKLLTDASTHNETIRFDLTFSSGEASARPFEVVEVLSGLSAEDFLITKIACVVGDKASAAPLTASTLRRELEPELVPAPAPVGCS